jgi:uncharacterized protein YeaO (DUF488 family)
VYDEPDKNDGFRILIDRMWPRGLKKEQAKIDLWLKDIAPSTTLRKWFGHQRAKWPEFKRRYCKELEQKDEAIDKIATKALAGIVTLLYAAKDEKCNNAIALKEFIEKRKHYQSR